MAVKACLNCASIRHLEWIGKSTAESGLIQFGSHLTGVYNCTRCGYSGLPLEFDKEKDYLGYYKQRESEWKPIVNKPSVASNMAYGYIKIMMALTLIVLTIIILFNILKLIL